MPRFRLGGLEAGEDQVHDVFDPPNRAQFLFFDLELEFLLESDREIDGVDTVEVEVVDQVRAQMDLVCVEFEGLDEDLPDSDEDLFFR